MKPSEYTTVSHWIDEIIDDIGNNSSFKEDQACLVASELGALKRKIIELYSNKENLLDNLVDFEQSLKSQYQMGYRAGVRDGKELSFTHIEPNDDAKQAAVHYMEDCQEVDDFIRKKIDDIAERYFCKGAEWRGQKIWRDVKNTKPEPRKRVLCINHSCAEVKVFLSTTIDEIDMYEKWTYIDDLIPNDWKTF